MFDLSVVIPARNEQFLDFTIDDVCRNIRGNTEVIVVCDGAWPDQGIVQRENVHVIYLPESIGQRAATNLGARISTATYIMKLDGHCAMAEGFDIELINTSKELGPHVTQIPTGYNLHVFDRICEKCGKREYQGPTNNPCVMCGETVWKKEIVWNAKRRRAVGWRFDGDLHYQTWGQLQHRPENKDQKLIETMSCLGACWFINREWFWQLGGLDEAHGSWGQMGTEIACKSWLSGGRMVCNTATWFSHMFRTQGGDFGFPYPISDRDQEKARQYSRNMWRSGSWPQQKRPLSWLVDKFWPVPGWTEEQRKALPVCSFDNLSGNNDRIVDLAPYVPSADERSSDSSAARRSTVRSDLKGIVYYTDNRLDEDVAQAVLVRLTRTCLPIVAVSLKPISVTHNIILPLERGYLAMFKQILAGLEAIDSEFVFFCEHDVLYHPSHFDFTPPNSEQVFYNQNVWKVDAATGHALHYLCSQTSGLCASRELLVEHYRKRVALVEANGFSRKMGFEPGTHRRNERVDDLTSVTWMSPYPNVDVRHSTNLTPSRWRKDEFRDQRYTKGWTEADAVPGWGVTKGRFREFLAETIHVQQAVA